MTSSLVKLFFKTESKVDSNEKVYTLEDYDNTFVIPKKVMTVVTTQMTHNLSDTRSKCWNIFFWVEVVHVLLLAIPAEFVSMVITALEAHGFNDAIKVFRMTPCFGSCVLSIIKSLKIKSNRGVFEALYYELREMWPQGEVSPEEHRIISAGLKQVNFIVKGYYWCNNILLLSYLSPPLFICVSRLLDYDTRMIFCFEYWLPFDSYKPYVFEITLLTQIWAATIVIYWNVLWDMLFCTYVAHITMQLDLLASRVRRLVYVRIDSLLPRSYPLAEFSREFAIAEKEALLAYTDEDWETMHQEEVVDIVSRHRALIKLAGDVESMFSFSLLVNFIYSSIIICFCGFCSVLIEKWNELAYKTFLLTALAQTWLLCWYGQQLLDSSHNVSLALYESGWYMASKRIRSAVLFMLQRAQKDIRVTTYGFSTISLTSFSAIVKTAWSYFTLLVNVYTRQ